MVNWIMITAKVAVWTIRLDELADKLLTNAFSLFRRRLIGLIKI